ncbi:MAG: hypothetical protein AAGL69_03610 [Pseudomonadota bacterium]
MNKLSVPRTLPLTIAATLMSLTTSGCAASGPDLGESRLISNSGKIEPMNAQATDVARLAAEVLAQSLGITVDQITVDSVRPIDWRDSSIGCPQPGEAYGQVITPGHKIALRVDGQMHVVHEANGRAFVCRNKNRVADLTNSSEFVWAKQALIARKSLASTLGVDPREIRVESARRMTWSDTGMGCPGPTDAAGKVSGYSLTLSHKTRRFNFNTDLNRVIACPAIEAD